MATGGAELVLRLGLDPGPEEPGVVGVEPGLFVSSGFVPVDGAPGFGTLGRWAGGRGLPPGREGASGMLPKFRWLAFEV